MDVPYRLPYLLDGGASHRNFTGEASELEEAAELTKQYIRSGAQTVSAPTGEANRFILGKQELDSGEVTLRAAQAVVAAADGRASVAGCLLPTGESLEPFGEVSFYDVLHAYTEQVRALKKAGADLVAVRKMTTLSEARAAVIAAKRAGMTVWVSFACDENGLTENDTSVLAAMLCLQEMGISAFGIEGGTAEDMAEILEELYAYSKLPLMARLSAAEGVSCDKFTSDAKLLLDSGADIIGGGDGTSPEHIAALKSLKDGYARTSTLEKAETGICLAGENQAFFLEADAIECTEPLECSLDLADSFVELAETNYDVMTVELFTDDDALLLSRSAYMASLPVMLRCDDIFVLKTALLTYSGRVMIDSTCSIDRAELEAAAEEYGAVIY